MTSSSARPTAHSTPVPALFSHAEALARSSSAELRRHVRAGRWVRLGRDAYAEAAVVEAAQADARSRHALDCAVALFGRRRDLVVSHLSAATLHELTLLEAYAGAPQLTLHRPGAHLPRHEHGLLTSHVPAHHRTELDALPLTTRARTVADCVRALPAPAALVTADAALRAGVARVDVLRVLAEQRRWPGVQDAVDVVVRADGRAESALESLARSWFSQAGLPVPQLQVELCRADDGVFVGRVDVAWLQHRTVVEMDGRLKYDQDQGSLWREKLREDALRDLGLEVVRGYWSDGPDGAALVERVRRAFARAATRPGHAGWGVLSRR